MSSLNQPRTDQRRTPRTRSLATSIFAAVAPLIAILLTCSGAPAQEPGMPAVRHQVRTMPGGMPATTRVSDIGTRMPAAADPVYEDGDVIYEGSPELFLNEFREFQPPGGEFACPPAWTVTTDALFLKREQDTQRSFSTGYNLNDFGFDLGGRITLSHRYDCLVGWELTYLGPYAWNQGGQATGTGLNASLPSAGVNLSAFNNAVFQEQNHSSRLQSAEFNQKWWGWDVISTTAGVRYLHIDEDLTFASVNALAETGSLAVAANNNLLGAQLGMDLHFPVGRLTSTARLRGGIYSNFIHTRTSIVNAGVQQVANSADDVAFASLLEVGYSFSYSITPCITARAGWEAMWLYGLGFAPDQVASRITAATGSEADGNADVVYQGGSFGVEVVW